MYIPSYGKLQIRKTLNTPNKKLQLRIYTNVNMPKKSNILLNICYMILIWDEPKLPFFSWQIKRLFRLRYTLRWRTHYYYGWRIEVITRLIYVKMFAPTNHCIYPLILTKWSNLLSGEIKQQCLPFFKRSCEVKTFTSTRMA